jgi:hypothetical protein
LTLERDLYDAGVAERPTELGELVCLRHVAEKIADRPKRGKSHASARNASEPASVAVAFRRGGGTGRTGRAGRRDAPGRQRGVGARGAGRSARFRLFAVGNSRLAGRTQQAEVGPAGRPQEAARLEGARERSAVGRAAAAAEPSAVRRLLLAVHLAAVDVAQDDRVAREFQLALSSAFDVHGRLAAREPAGARPHAADGVREAECSIRRLASTRC